MCPRDYVHRIGRTGRAGSKGQAVSLVCADEFNELSDIEHLIKQIIPRQMIQGFNPEKTLPESRLDRRPKKIKKPKKPKESRKPKVQSSVTKSKPKHKPKRAKMQKKKDSSHARSARG